MEYKDFEKCEKAEAGDNIKDISVFTLDEWEAINKVCPMTYEMFINCIEKCIFSQIDDILFELLNEYSDFVDKYAESIEEKAMNRQQAKRSKNAGKGLYIK